MICRECGTILEAGIALDDIVDGVPDFIGDDFVCTVSPSGKAKLIKCLKCPRCGWSIKGESK